MKLYSVKSSAVRAAKAAGLKQYEIIEQDGQFGFRSVKTQRAKRTQMNEGEALEQYERELDEAQNPESVEVPEKLVSKTKKKPAAKSKRAPAKKVAPTVASVSTIESPVRRVWEIADSMPDAKRKDVVDACVAQGINFFTARTQYQKWRQSQAT